MHPAAQWMMCPLGRPAVWLAVATLYCLLGVAALNWAVIQENTAVLWPATGLAVAAVLRLGYGVWPGVALGAAAVVLTTSAPPAAALVIGAGNTLEALAGVWLYRRLAGPGEPLSDVRRALLFIVAAVLVGPLLSAGLGAFALHRFVDLPVSALPRVALTWWLGNVTGALQVAPVLLAWTAPAGQLRAVHPLEWAALLLATLAVCLLAFGWGGLPDAHYPLSFLPFPVVLWAALRFCQRGGTLVSLLVAVAAVVSTTLGRGPFSVLPFGEGYWLLLAYLLLGGGTLLLMTVVVRQWFEQHQALERSRAELEARVEERTRALSEANAALAESERRLRLVVSEAPLILWSIDPQACFTFIQGRGLEALGARPDELLGREPADVFQGNPGIAENCARLLGGEAVQSQLSLGGRVFELHAVPLRRGGARVEGAIGVCLDVTERARAEEKLRLDATVFANTTEGVMITDAAGHILAVNAAFSEITGYAEGEALGRTPRLLRSDRHDDAFYRDLWRALAGQGRWQGEIWNRRKNGEVYPEWLSISAVRDGGGATTHYVAVFSDISTLKLSERQLDYLAYHDPLTGLANRLLFNERLGHAIQRAEREHKGLAVMFLDLDHFKHVNDSLGHPVGDELLAQLARRLVEAMRSEDTVARLGGDEFVVLAEGIDGPEAAATIAGKLLDTCRQPFRLAARELYVGGSIGISLYPNDGTDADHLVKNADAALYQAKGGGRNTFRFYTAELTRRALERVELEAELRRALEAEEFELHYQPQVCLKTGNILAVEALLRWRHPERGLLTPDAFLRVAEDSGLIVPIGAWVLKAACRQMSAWLEEGCALEHIAVNLAGIQLEREGLEQTLQAALDEAGLSPYFLELEITEGALALERAEPLLRRLKTLGLRISVDDFGTGFSSLGYLGCLPLNGLKIDRSFIRGGERDEVNEAIVESILALGRGLGLGVVAEGVESEAELAWLKRLGCDTAQGYYFFRPLPAVEVARHFVPNRAGA